MEIPDPFKTREGYSFSSVEALCILLYRFRMDADIHDITSRFDRSSCAVSMVINDLLLFLDDTWSHLLGFDSDRLLSRQKIRAYAAAIHAAGAPTETVWGFIDCTIRRICRPSYLQRIAYSGYKHFHAMKYQGVVLPNGLFANLFGPFEGRRNDNAVLHDSGLKETCRKRAYTRDSEGREQYYQLFGDPAYVGISRELMSPYTGSRLSEDQQRFNAKMSHFRIEVEHAFAVALNQWPFLDHWKRHRVYSSPIGRYYRIGILLTNSMTCLRGRNQISDTFRCPPPTLEEYFHH
ncbi:uncharacterized protein STEHIDRAFT_162765 [Stereum hirsutum FP-91666 SS1]|uniref:DDE Tnp4 domain-containing protein n=1 Tax=Stereum hirsutum (strain FP-91666) TaxID=721885 RepID=R7RZS2_STEHR|nr:uncharacterized protein STEHIDRAFT_162765 [Stereum hirsutum FP-91666 SS1]EIM80348.1 hypothetical protein STEHIDRAFT_162765 [Stereum hirsutum FP-91666 SS1]